MNEADAKDLLERSARENDQLETLDIAALRKRVITANEGFKQTDISAYARLLPDLTISRRSLLKGAGAAAAGLALLRPALLIPDGSKWRRTRVVRNGRRVAFLRDDLELFAIDADAFSPSAGINGKPKLSLRRGKERTRVLLRDARFSGTELRADLIAELREVRGSERLTISFFRLGWKFEIDDFIAWANGREAAIATARENLLVTRMGREGVLWLRAPARLRFCADWSLIFSGVRCALLAGFVRSINANRMAIRPCSGEKAELLRDRHASLTEIELARDDNRWGLLAATELPDGARLISPDEPADRIRVETSETKHGDRAVALLAEARDDEVPWSFEGQGSREAIQIPIGAVKQAVSFTERTSEAIVLGTMPQRGAELRWGSFALLVGARSDRPVLELIARQDQPPSLRVEPALNAVKVPLHTSDLSSIVVHTSEVPFSSSIGIYFGEAPPDVPTDSACILGSNDELRLCRWKTSILRPRDMLVLDFEFQGFSLKEHHGIPYLFKRKDSPDACIVVTFPPQHISDKLTTREKAEGHPLELDFCSGPRAWASPPSRVVFQAPDWLETEGLPFCLENLLDWQEWQMRVSPIAIPRPGVPRPLLPEHWIQDWSYPVEHADGPDNRPPTLNETALFIPRFMILSPHAWSVWHHSVVPAETVLGDQKEQRRIAQLWHTRLAPFQADGINPITGRLRSDRDLQDTAVAGSTPDHTNSKSKDDLNGKKPPPALQTIRAVGTVKSDDCSLNSLPTWPDANQIAHLSSDFNLPPVKDLKCWGPPTLTPCDKYLPEPIPYEQFMLSALGATLKLEGTWNPSLIDSTDYTIEQWNQETIWGRDQSQLVAYKGYAMPTGHHIAFIRKAEREFRWVKMPSGDCGYGAVEVINYYCEVKEPTIVYPPVGDGEPTEGRRWPYKSVTLSPARTPDLERPIDILTGHCANTAPEINGICAFWMFPFVDKDCNEPDTAKRHPFEFTLTCVDHDDQTTVYKLPLLWVNRNVAEPDIQEGITPNKCADPLQVVPITVDLRGQIGRVVCEYRTAFPNRRKTKASGQRIALVPAKVTQESDQANPHKRDTAFATDFLVFNVVTNDESLATVLDPNSTSKAAMEWPRTFCYLSFLPVLERWTIRLRSVQMMSAPGKENELTWVRYNDVYRKVGFCKFGLGAANSLANKGEVFIDLLTGVDDDDRKEIAAELSADEVKSNQRFDLAGKTGGGLATPQMSIAHLSRIIGPVGGQPLDVQALSATTGTTAGGNAEFIKGQFDPKKFFAILGEDGPKLLGVVRFKDVLALIPDIGNQLAKIPQLVEDELQAVNQVLQDVQKVDEFRQEAQRLLEVFNNLRNLNLNLAKALQALLSDAIDSIRQNYLDPIVKIAESSFEEAFKDQIVGPLTDLAASLPADKATEVYRKTLELYERDRRLIQDQVLSVEYWKARLNDRLTQAKSALLTLPYAPFADTISMVKQFEQTLALLSSEPGQMIGTLFADLKNVGKVVEDTKAKLSGNFAVTVKQALDQQKDNLVSNLADAFCDSEVVQAIETSLNHEWVDTFDKASQTYVDYYTKADQQYQKARADFLQALEKQHGLLDKCVATVNKSVNDAIEAGNMELESALGELTRQVTDKIIDQKDAIQGFYDQAAGFLAKLNGAISSINGAIPREVQVSYQLTPKLQDAPQDAPIFLASRNGQNATLELTAQIRKRILPDGGPQINSDVLKSPPQTTVTAVLSDFTIQLIPSFCFLSIGFEQLRVQSINGASPDVTATVGSVELGRELGFLRNLQQLLAKRDGPYLDIQPSGLSTGYRFAMPTIQVGAFALTQLAFSLGIVLSFQGDPARARFQISSRNKPFLLTSGIYGGGGFFALEATPQGVETVEISLEFGAVTFIDLGGLASGIAKAVGGIYFCRSKSIVQLTGFFRASGSFNVIGLIELNIDFYLGFTYAQGQGRSYVAGDAELTVEIGYSFFSIKVTLHQHKEIDGNSSNASTPGQNQNFNMLVLKNGVPVRQPAPAEPRTVGVRTGDEIWKSWQSRRAGYLSDSENVYAW